MRIARVLLVMLLVLVALLGCKASPPKARFKASPTDGYVPIEVLFTDLSEGDIDTWEWDFNGDGLTDSTLQNPRYIYSRAGVYTVSLAVSGPGGRDSQMRASYLDFESPCKADFIAEPTSGEGVTEVQFSDKSTGEITSWSWDFNGDGSIDSTEQNPTYEYKRNGVYSVTLTVAGPYCKDRLKKEDYIEITGCPG